jgi:hypothetical protein
MLATVLGILAFVSASAVPSNVAQFTRPCDGRSFPWCDHSKPMDERASLLVANLTQDEKKVHAHANARTRAPLHAALHAGPLLERCGRGPAHRLAGL